jgi:hypothetical protein
MIKGGRDMQGRTALAGLVASVALAGCGAQAPPQAASIEIVKAPAATATAAPVAAAPAASQKPRTPRRRVGRMRSGTYKTAPLVAAPAVKGTVVPVRAAKRRRTKPDYARFRAAQLEVLRTHCATRPKDDPRCDGTRVNERVAFAAFEGTK